MKYVFLLRVWTGTTGLAEWNELVFPPSNFVSIKHMLEEAIKEQGMCCLSDLCHFNGQINILFIF